MHRRAAVVTAVLLGLLAPAVPASAAGRVAVSGRVLDETGRGVPSATVRFSVDPKHLPGTGFFEGLAEALVCLFSLFIICEETPAPDTTSPLEVTARTDSRGRYVLRFDPAWRVGAHVVHHIDVTRPALIRGTLPPTTHTTVRYRGGKTLPAFRLWLRGASLDPVGKTQRRLRAVVPKAFGTPVDAPAVDLVQGSRTVWSYGAVSRDRTVDTRVSESGTTGTQTRVVTRIGSAYATYRSGVRPVPKPVRPLSRGKRCYGYRGSRRSEVPGCPLTDGRLAHPPAATFEGRHVVVDLGELSTPEAYVTRGCPVYAVAASVEGVVFLDVDVEEKERRVYTGKPAVPVRYVRLDLGQCRPAGVSVFGSPFAIPVPPAPRVPAETPAGVDPLPLPALPADVLLGRRA